MVLPLTKARPEAMREIRIFLDVFKKLEGEEENGETAFTSHYFSQERYDRTGETIPAQPAEQAEKTPDEMRAAFLRHWRVRAPFLRMVLEILEKREQENGSKADILPFPRNARTE